MSGLHGPRPDPHDRPRRQGFAPRSADQLLAGFGLDAAAGRLVGGVRGVRDADEPAVPGA